VIHDFPVCVGCRARLEEAAAPLRTADFIGTLDKLRRSTGLPPIDPDELDMIAAAFDSLARDLREEGRERRKATARD